MKLHLPKQLFTALLAALTLAAPATLTLGSAAWGGVTVSTTDNPTTVSNTEGWSRTYDSVLKNTSGNNDNISAATYNSTEVGATIVTGGRIQINGGTANDTSDNVVSTYGGDLITGGSGHFFLQTYGKGQIDLSNDFYLGGSTAYDSGIPGYCGDIRFGNNAIAGYATNLTGNLYLRANSMLYSGGTNAILISGKVTDDIAEGDTTPSGSYTGSYTLTIQGKGYQFAGNIDLSGLTLASGSAVSLDGTTTDGTTTTTTTTTVNISSLTNSGALTLGTTNATITTLTNNNSNATVTVNNGATLALVGDASINSGSMNIKSGAKLTGTLTNNGTLSLADFTLDAGATATITGTGTTTLSGPVTNNGTMELGGITTLSGTVTNNGTMVLGGTLDFSAATLSTETALITLGSEASLTFNSGTIFKFADLEAGTPYKFIDASVGNLTGWDESITAEQIYIGGVQLSSSGYSITTSGGVFSFKQLISSLTWTGSANDGIWNSSSQNWTTGSKASAYANSVDTSFAGDANVTVAEAVTTGNLTIGKETATTVSLSAGEGASLAVASGKTLSIGANSTLNSALGIDVSAASVIMGEGASWNLTGTAQQNLTKAQLGKVTRMDIGKNASLTVDATAAAALSTIDASKLTGTGTVALSMNNNTSNGLKAGLSNFTGTIQLGDGAAGDTTNRYDNDNTEYLIYTGSNINTSATISLLNGGGLAFSKTTSSKTTSTAELPEKMTNALVVSNGGSAAQTKAGSTVHVDDSVYAEISGGISGTGQLFKKGAGTLSLSGNTTVSALKVMDGTLNLGGTANLTYLGVGGGSSVADSSILNITGTVSADQLRMGEQGHAAVNIQSGGSLTIEGAVNDGTSRSLLLTHWGEGSNSTLTLDGGNLTSTGARMFLSWTGTGAFKANSGVANLLGIDFQAQGGKRGNFDLGSETEGSARVNIGADGIANVDDAAVVIKLGEGTLGALSDWEMAANTSNTGNVQLISTKGGTVFNTEDADTPGTGRTITINAALSGNGKLVKDGVGTLKLSGANTYTGGTTVKGGVLQIANGGSAGTGAVEVLTGATLDVAALPTDWTAASMLSGKVTGTGTLQISQSGLNTGDSGLTTAFTGKVELAKNVTFTFGSTGNAKDGQVINTSSLTGVILNNGSVLKFQGTGDNAETNGSSLSQFRNVEVNGTAEINLIDTQNSNDQDAVYLSETTNLKDGSNLNLTAGYDGRIIIDNLKGSGALTSNGTTHTSPNSKPIFYTTIKELDGFTGTLNFTDTDYHTVSVSTGTDVDSVSFASLNMVGGTDVNNTFNVQTNTTVGTVSLSGSSNSIVLSEGKSLSVGTGTVTNGSLSTGSAEVASKSADTPASLSHVKMTGSGFSAAASANGSKGSISNAQLTQLQEDATFTIQDMTLTNTTITAATTTEVKLQNVTATNTMLAGGKNYTLSGLNAASVGTGGSNRSITYSTGLGVASGATLTLNLDVLGAVEQHGSGVYDITITLDGFGADYAFTQEDLAGLVKFDADSWLGKVIGNVTPEVSIVDEEQAAALSDNVGAAATPSVSYTATPSVGTLTITITGLNVPEPASATLGLAALMMLCARRRRKA